MHSPKEIGTDEDHVTSNEESEIQLLPELSA